ncbi:MAG: hypothetical protein LUG99_17395 [Lachnospiraceae bacterium]|nr:hypothetical protein [Lachnospiraceae bacterium]
MAFKFFPALISTDGNKIVSTKNDCIISDEKISSRNETIREMDNIKKSWANHFWTVIMKKTPEQ